MNKEELIIKHKGLVKKLAYEWKIEGLTGDDIEQELYLTLIKAAKNYIKNKGAQFSTYFYKAASNKRNDLYKKAKNSKTIHDFSIDHPGKSRKDEALDSDNLIYQKRSSSKKDEYFSDFDNLSKSITASLDNQEINFLDLLNQGYKYVEMLEVGINVKAIRKSLRKKIDKNVFYS